MIKASIIELSSEMKKDKFSIMKCDCLRQRLTASILLQTTAHWQQGEYGSRPFLKHKIGILTRARKPTIFTEKPPHTERITLRKAKDEVFRFHKYKNSHFLGFKFKDGEGKSH